VGSVSSAPYFAESSGPAKCSTKSKFNLAALFTSLRRRFLAVSLFSDNSSLGDQIVPIGFGILLEMLLLRESVSIALLLTVFGDQFSSCQCIKRISSLS